MSETRISAPTGGGLPHRPGFGGKRLDRRVASTSFTGVRFVLCLFVLPCLFPQQVAAHAEPPRTLKDDLSNGDWSMPPVLLAQTRPKSKKPLFPKRKPAATKPVGKQKCSQWVKASKELEKTKGPAWVLSLWKPFVQKNRLNATQRRYADQEVARLEALGDKKPARPESASKNLPPRDPGSTAWNRLVDELQQLEKSEGPKAALARWEKVIAEGKLQGDKRKFASTERARLWIKSRQREIKANSRKKREERKKKK